MDEGTCYVAKARLKKANPSSTASTPAANNMATAGHPHYLPAGHPRQGSQSSSATTSATFASSYLRANGSSSSLQPKSNFSAYQHHNNAQQPPSPPPKNRHHQQHQDAYLYSKGGAASTSSLRSQQQQQQQHHHHHLNHRPPLSTSLVNPASSSSASSNCNGTPPPPPSRGTASQLAAARNMHANSHATSDSTHRRGVYEPHTSNAVDAVSPNSAGESLAVLRRPKNAVPDAPQQSQDVPRRPKNSGGVATAAAAAGAGGGGGGTGTWASKRHGMYLQQSHPPHQSVRASIAVMNVPDEGGSFALEGKPPLPPTEGAAGNGSGGGGTTAGAAAQGPRPPPRTRPKSWTSSLFNAMSRQNHKSVNFQSVLEEQQSKQAQERRLGLSSSPAGPTRVPDSICSVTSGESNSSTAAYRR